MFYIPVSAPEIAQCVQAEDRDICLFACICVYNREEVYVSFLGTGKTPIRECVCKQREHEGLDLFGIGN